MAAKKPHLFGSLSRRMEAYSFTRRANALLSTSVEAMTAPGAVRDRIAFVAPFLSSEAIELEGDQAGVGQPDGSPPASSTTVIIDLISDGMASSGLAYFAHRSQGQSDDAYQLLSYCISEGMFCSTRVLQGSTASQHFICPHPSSCLARERIPAQTLCSQLPSRLEFRVLPGYISGSGLVKRALRANGKAPSECQPQSGSFPVGKYNRHFILTISAPRYSAAEGSECVALVKLGMLRDARLVDLDCHA